LPIQSVSRRPELTINRPATRWEFRTADPAAQRRIEKEVGLPPLVARILTARGFDDPEQARRFLQPRLSQLHDPFGLKGMEAAVERVARALGDGEAIQVYGDYDVDGITGTAILMLTLRELGAAAVDYYIPNRLTEGYGINTTAIDLLAAEGARLIISVDCGIRAVAEAEHARGLGVDLIITDHHEPGPELPDAVALINPKQPGCDYPFKGLAGTGVAFKLAHGVLKRCHPDPAAARAFLTSLIDLVTLGTVADVVPLRDENRSLVAHGLGMLRATERPGLRQLLAVAEYQPRKVDAGSIGFVLGPRLNAAGRTEHALHGVELLLSDDESHARDLASKLDGLNTRRREIEKQILDEALALIEEQGAGKVIVVAQDEWHHGVLGIVAARILGLFYRPTIVLGVSEGKAKGSGRSIAGFDLHEALLRCDDYLEQYGGHAMAAGMSLDPDRIDAFRAAINAHADDVLDEATLRPLVMIDAPAEPSDLTEAGIGALAALAPHGQDNPKPIVALEGYTLIEPPRVLKERHLKLKLVAPDGRPLTALAWGMADRHGELNGHGQQLRLAGTPFVNEWNGRRTVELELVDFKLD